MNIPSLRPALSTLQSPTSFLVCTLELFMSLFLLSLFSFCLAILSFMQKHWWYQGVSYQTISSCCEQCWKLTIWGWRGFAWNQVQMQKKNKQYFPVLITALGKGFVRACFCYISLNFITKLKKASERVQMGRDVRGTTVGESWKRGEEN